MMTFQFKHVALIAMISLYAVGVVMADTDYGSLKRISDKIVAKMPNTWRVVEEKTGVIPYGHYDGLKYEGPGGLALVLEGDRAVFLHWVGIGLGRNRGQIFTLDI